MTQSLYLTPGDIGNVIGRYQTLWKVLGDSNNPNQFSTTQKQLVSWLSARIDQLTGQRGGLLAQTGVFYTENCDRQKNVIFVPNKPVTNVTSIWVQPKYGLGASLPVTFLAPGTAPGPSQATPPNTYAAGQRIQYIIRPASSGASPVSISLTDPPFSEGDVVTVTYDCGYTVTPEAVKLSAQYLLGVQLFNIADNPGGAASIAEDRAHVMYAGRQAVINPVSAEAEDILMPFHINVLL